jgi:hypothetical protein
VGIETHGGNIGQHASTHGDPERTSEVEKTSDPQSAVHNASHGDAISVSPDGQYSIEFVECLASCGSAPVAMVDDRFKENIRLEEVAQLLNFASSDATTPRVRAPHPRETRLVFKNIDREGWSSDIDCYLRDGGYEDLKKAFTMKPEEIVNEVKASGLRGRGGAGFPCGVKWELHQARAGRSRRISSATRTSRSPALSRTATSSTRTRIS